MNRTTHRHGLAMLELTLALPLLLLIMALMINYGTVACWKVRALAVADYTISGVRYPRNADTLPRPGNPYYWPLPGATYNTANWVAPTADVPAVNLPIVRGPTLDLNLGPDRILQVNSNLLDPSGGFREGHADLDRGFAMVARWGQYHLHAHDEMLENLWQYRRTHLGSNVTRRLDVLYTLLKSPEGFSSAFTAAVWAILSAPWLQDLWPLERDLPDFPDLPYRCTSDREMVDKDVEDYLLDPKYGLSIPNVLGRLEALFPPDPIWSQP